MPVIGITGSLGSGKSTVAAMFKARGATVIDADAVTRGLLVKSKKCIKKVAKIFPGAILGVSKVDRSQLAGIVFRHPRELKKLTDILYPEALKAVRRQISLKKHTSLIVLDVPLLFEAGWDRLTDITIVVTAKRRQMLERASRRLGFRLSEARRRLKFQMPLKEKRALADMLIDNSQSLSRTRKQVDAIIDRLKKRQEK